MADDKKKLSVQITTMAKIMHQIPNAIGIPIVFIYFVYVLSGSIGALTENKAQFIKLFLGSAFLISGAIYTHIRKNKKLLKNACDFLDDSKRKETESAEEFSERARKAIICLLEFPSRSAVHSLFTWPASIASIIFCSYVALFKFPISLMLVLVMGGVSGGVLVAVFQFYLFKQGVHRFLIEILKAYPQYWREDRFFKVNLSLRKKMLASFVCLMIVMLTMMAVIIYFDTTKIISSEWAKMTQRDIRQKMSVLVTQLNQAATGEEKLAVLNNLNLKYDGATFYLLNSKGVSLLPGAVTDSEKEIFGKVMGVRSNKKVEKSLTIMAPLLNIQNASFNLETGDMKTNTWIKISGTDYTILVRRSFRTFVHLENRLVAASILIVFLGIVISVIFAQVATKDVTQPVDELVGAVEKVSRGDLTYELHLLTYDEVGLLAVNIKRMIENLRAMIHQIGEAASRVEGATVSIVEGFQRVSEGSRTQSNAVEETSAAHEEMNASIKGIGENVETLASTAQESSASIMEMSATIEEVADNVENLAASVEQTTSSIAEMAASVRQVAENVESLSRKAENTVSSVTQMEASIKEVQAGAEETAEISEMVANDAESGADKVQNTISGISRAREDSELAVRVIQELAQRAEEIGNILTVIDDVTDETNLLALNAAIIAAQAGEHGRGFAVVADEIKDLAERTAQSTQEISQLIDAVQRGGRQAVDAVSRGYSAVQQGVSLSQEAGLALSKILSSAQKSTQRTHDIARATVEQAKRTKEVLNFFEEISENIHQVEVATREQSKGSDQIQKTSERMREIAKLVKKATQEQFMGSKQITQAIENINHIVSFINSSQQEQISNTEQVLKAIQEIRAIAGQNEEGVEEMFQASANLSSLAEELRSMVEAFKLQNA